MKLITFAFILVVSLSAFAQVPPKPTTPPSPEVAREQARQVELDRAQMEKMQAQAALLEKTLQGITEFRQWLQIQQQMQALAAKPQSK